MSTSHIVDLLVAERSRLQAAIDALGGEESNMPDWVLGKKAPQKTAGHTSLSRSEQMKENWRKRKAAQSTVAVVATEASAPKKRIMSEEGRQPIIDATKARWAKVRAAAKAEAVAPKKKAPSKKSAIMAAVTPSAEDVQFKARMSAAMKKAWAKRKKAAAKKKKD